MRMRHLEIYSYLIYLFRTETEMISDGKARQKNVTGDETKLIQVQKGLSSTISKNRLMDL